MFTRSARILLLALASLVLLLAVACGDDDDDDDASDSTTAPAAATTPAASDAPSETPQFEDVTIDWAGATLDYGSLLEYAAAEILADQGITMNITFGLDPPTVTQLMVQGDAVGGWGPVVAYVPAIDQGAGIKIVLNGVRNTFSYASDPSITTIEDLSGKKMAVHSEVSFTKTVTDALIEKYSLTDVEQLIIQGSDVRLQALLDNQIDATTVDIADVARLSATQGSDSVNLLGTVSSEFPDLLYTVVPMSQDFIDEQPDVAQAVVDAFKAAADKMNSDPEYAISLAEEHLPDDSVEVREAIINAYIDAGVWDTELSQDISEATLDFLYQYGSIEVDPATVDITTYFDFSLAEN